MISKFESSVLKTCIVLLILTAGHVTSLIIKDIPRPLSKMVLVKILGVIMTISIRVVCYTGPDICHIFPT